MISKELKKTKLGKSLLRGRAKAEVNLGKLDKLTKANDTVVVPGKVLGDGELTHPITIAALAFSKSAEEKIKKAGCKKMFIGELKSSKNVRLIT